MTERFVTLQFSVSQWSDIIDALHLDAEIRHQDIKNGQFDESEEPEMNRVVDETLKFAAEISRAIRR